MLFVAQANGESTHMQLHVIQALVDTVDDLHKLLARRRKCWVLKSLRKMFGLREML